MKALKEQNKAKKVVGQKLMHKTIVRIVGVLKRMYEAQNEPKLNYEDFLTKIENSTPDEFYNMNVKEKN